MGQVQGTATGTPPDVGQKGQSGCPVDHGSSASATTAQSQAQAPEGTGCPVSHERGMNGSSCPSPLNQAGTDVNPLNMMPQLSQLPLPGQRRPLSTDREASSIPMGEYRPAHQPTDAPTWTYPSEQQYYNAMKRKGWNPKEEDVPFVLAIHNVVNEKGWSEILKWEAFHPREGGETPRLVRFMGKPTELSPKARLKTWFGYTPPFDRHDWVIERNGEEVRYVIDFYSGKPDPQKPVSIHIDCRPAVDSVENVFDRVRMQVYETLGLIPPPPPTRSSGSPTSSVPSSHPSAPAS